MFQALNERVGHKYYVFPQIHLDDLLDHKIKGQDWRAALSYIQRKSVVFVLVDKQTLITEIAIELDDPTHDSPKRGTRDDLVNAIFEKTGVKLVRGRSFDEILNQIDSGSNKHEDDIYQKVKEYTATLQAVSTSDLQREFGIGYARARQLFDILEKDRVIAPTDGSNNPRKVL